ncbi:MAG TPA: PD-(D/E)XK motif protein [Gemmatimonadaceae bacterium]
MPDLTPLYATLEAPQAANSTPVFAAREIPGYGQHRIAKGAAGEPALLLEVSDGGGWARPAPIALQNLVVQHRVECIVQRPSGEEETKRFTVVQCIGSDPDLQHYFVRIAGVLVEGLGAKPEHGDVARVINSIVALFHALVRPARKSVQGLWAELFIIAKSKCPEVLVEAWHSEPEDRYDFSAGASRLEVKSSGSGRQHYFSHEQAYPPAGAEVVIASLVVDRSTGGTSLGELLDVVRSKVAGRPELATRVETVVAEALGESLQPALMETFDAEEAVDSLRFYPVASVPRLAEELPPGISEVRYKADLTGAALAPTSLMRRFELFRAVAH